MQRPATSVVRVLLWVSLFAAYHGGRPPLRAETPAAAAIPDAIHRFVDRAEPEFRWEQLETHETPRGDVHELHLVSQTWHDIKWEHALLVYEPRKLMHPRHMLLMVTGGKTGGRPRPEDMQTGLALANFCGARIATLHQVPNQPLLGDHVEDDLITETWLRYLETGDDSWPLLFPMVKSAVKAMDALQQFSRQEWQQEIEGFVITGGSKRGWTSWLTPVADERVIATAPLVIDMLNFPAQMRYQIETWGVYSEQIADYTRKGLVKPEGVAVSEREQRLWQMMDPYTYREQLTLPKLLVMGTNDRYWVVDAVKNYWDDLQGLKYIREVPNAGHSLDGGREGALKTVAAFFRYNAVAEAMPALTWESSNGADGLTLRVRSEGAPRAARVWTASSPTKDFRTAAWTSRPLEPEGGAYVAVLGRPARGYASMFIEIDHEREGLAYSLSTRVYQQ